MEDKKLTTEEILTTINQNLYVIARSLQSINQTLINMQIEVARIRRK